MVKSEGKNEPSNSVWQCGTGAVSDTMKLDVYCVHVWDKFGPETYRCMRCQAIWKKFEDPIEPRIVSGYCELPRSK